MQRVTRSTAVPSLPSPPVSPGPPGYFTGGDPVSNVPPTVPGYEWFNGVQEEIAGLIARGGLTPDGADLAQVRKSLDRLYGGGLRTVAANITLSPDDAGIVLVDAAAASRTITLPAANAANGRPLRFTFVRVDTAAANTVTIERAGGDTIEGQASIAIPLGGRMVLHGDGASAWRRVGGAAPLGRMQAFSSSGTFTVPAGVYRVRVICTGGGGAGAGTITGGGGGGGSGGQTAIGWYDVTPGQAIAVTVGAGGVGASAANGGNGGTSSFGAFCTAPGGVGGQVASGSGGISVTGATGGVINIWGGDGGDGTSSSASGLMGGMGGSSFWGGGGRPGAISGGGGQIGRAPGSGGGGCYAAGVTGSGPGGDGRGGIVVVEW